MPFLILNVLLFFSIDQTFSLLNSEDYQVLKDLFYNTSGDNWQYTNQIVNGTWQFEYEVDLCANGGIGIWEGKKMRFLKLLFVTITQTIFKHLQGLLVQMKLEFVT